jgi:hypothetical protein
MTLKEKGVIPPFIELLTSYDHENIDPTVIDYAANFIRCFPRDSTIATEPYKPQGKLVVRLIRGDGTWLASDHNREIVFTADEKTAARLIGKNEREMLLTVKYTPAEADYYIGQKTQFNLMVAPFNDNANLFRQANLENLLGLVAFRHMDLLEGIMDVLDNPLVFLDPKLRPPGSEMAILYDRVREITGIKDLYTGTGTLNSDSDFAENEYVGLNRPVADLKGYVVIPIPPPSITSV